MYPRQNTKQSTTGIFFTHGAYWIRLLAPRHMYRWFSILAGHNRLFYKIHSSLPHKEQRGKNGNYQAI